MIGVVETKWDGLISGITGLPSVRSALGYFPDTTICLAMEKHCVSRTTPHGCGKILVNLYYPKLIFKPWPDGGESQQT